MGDTSYFKASQVVEAFEAAKTANRPLTDVMYFDWQKTRPAANGTKYVPAFFVVGGVSKSCTFRFKNEKHVGQIAPADDEEVARLNTELGAGRAQIKKRDRDPCLQFQKWSSSVPTEEDGITIRKREDGTDDLPGDESRSSVFELISYMEEVFCVEAEKCIKNGKIVQRTPRKDPPKDPSVIVTDNLKIVSMVQRTISPHAIKNAGKPLPNPIVRAKIKFDDTSGRAHGSYHRRGTPLPLVDEEGKPPDKFNVHKLFVTHAIVDGVICVDALCISKMGLSMPIQVKVAVVSSPKKYQLGLKDVYSDEEADEEGGAAGGQAAIDESHFNDLLNKLTVGDAAV